MRAGVDSFRPDGVRQSDCHLTGSFKEEAEEFNLIFVCNLNPDSIFFYLQQQVPVPPV